MTNWMPDANAATKAGGGWLLEVPIRASGLPVNLWVHWSGLTANWPPYFFGGTQNSDWDRETTTVMAPIAEGDVAVAGQATLGLSAVRREEQGFLDTDDWGVSCIDSLDPLQAPVVGPNWAVFSWRMAHRGKAFPGGISGTIDLLVLRKSLIPAVPLVHGAPPRVHPQMSASTIKKTDAVNDTRAALRRQLFELLAAIETDTAQEFAKSYPALTTTNDAPSSVPMIRFGPVLPQATTTRLSDIPPDRATGAQHADDRPETAARRTPGKTPAPPRRRQSTETDAPGKGGQPR
jgi:hypothetical protein